MFSLLPLIRPTVAPLLLLSIVKRKAWKNFSMHRCRAFVKSSSFEISDPITQLGEKDPTISIWLIQINELLSKLLQASPLDNKTLQCTFCMLCGANLTNDVSRGIYFLFGKVFSRDLQNAPIGGMCTIGGYLDTKLGGGSNRSAGLLFGRRRKYGQTCSVDLQISFNLLL